MATDPVCKMQVDEANPPGGKTEHRGQTYYFCGAGCKRAFEGNPASFVKA